MLLRTCGCKTVVEPEILLLLLLLLTIYLFFTGTYTEILLKHFTTPNLEARKMLDDVNAAVVQRTEGEQEPVCTQLKLRLNFLHRFK